MKRLYFLVPDLKTIHDISQELEHTGVKHRHIHAVGATPEKLEEAHVHCASVLQTTSLLPALKKGILLSGFIVVAIFLLFYWFLPEDIKITVLGVAAVFVFGTGFGIWVSGMIGLSTKDPIIEKNKDYVSTGHFILIAEVPKERAKELETKVVRHHPGARVASEPMQH